MSSSLQKVCVCSPCCAISFAWIRGRLDRLDDGGNVRLPTLWSRDEESAESPVTTLTNVELHIAVIDEWLCGPAVRGFVHAKRPGARRALRASAVKDQLQGL
ncbi:hypothetical protein GCM10009539_25000 [Cryptosporangium japonicum]|uniref:Uncharacterized protein n=1 Tax=Cryptosporangium japonicum TaxID=80872 RepID=A0ABN0U4S5_9ACTN